jgi:hypothetical protein
VSRPDSAGVCSWAGAIWSGSLVLVAGGCCFRGGWERLTGVVRLEGLPGWGVLLVAARSARPGTSIGILLGSRKCEPCAAGVEPSLGTAPEAGGVPLGARAGFVGFSCPPSQLRLNLFRSPSRVILSSGFDSCRLIQTRARAAPPDFSRVFWVRRPCSWPARSGSFQLLCCV